MAKSAIYTASTGTQTVSAGGTIALGSVVRRFGGCVNLNGNGINLTAPGYYLVNVSTTASPTAAGNISLTMLNNGVAVPGAISTSSVSTAGSPATLDSTIIIKVNCCGNAATLTLVMSSAATVNNVAVTVVKI
jgi:hypothetical protein